MAHQVDGKSIVLTAYNGDEYIPFACVQDVTINQTKDILATATPDSGTDRTYAYGGLRETSITMTGVTFLRDTLTGKMFAFDLFGSPTLVIRIVYTDVEGYTRSIDCTVIVPNITIDGTAGQLSHWNTTFRVSGALTYDAAAPVPSGPTDVISESFETPDGQAFFIPLYSVTGLALINLDIIEVWREGTQYDMVTGTPANRQYKYTAASGRFDFQDNFEADEKVFIVWQDV